MAHGGRLLHLIGVDGAGIDAERFSQAGIGHLQRVERLGKRVDALFNLFDGLAHLIFGDERLIGVLERGGERVQVTRAPIGFIGDRGCAEAEAQGGLAQRVRELGRRQ